ncbi:MAG: hypothetical protein HOV94_08680 [Saccharothrix sp.]|nr:hypothetical protein [Saccharothrix sp.]
MTLLLPIPKAIAFHALRERSARLRDFLVAYLTRTPVGPRHRLRTKRQIRWQRWKCTLADYVVAVLPEDRAELADTTAHPRPEAPRPTAWSPPRPPTRMAQSRGVAPARAAAPERSGAPPVHAPPTDTAPTDTAPTDTAPTDTALTTHWPTAQPLDLRLTDPWPIDPRTTDAWHTYPTSPAGFPTFDPRPADLHAFDLLPGDGCPVGLPTADPAPAGPWASEFQPADAHVFDLWPGDGCPAGFPPADLQSADLQSADLPIADLPIADTAPIDIASIDIAPAEATPTEVPPADTRSAAHQTADIRPPGEWPYPEPFAVDLSLIRALFAEDQPATRPQPGADTGSTAVAEALTWEFQVGDLARYWAEAEARLDAAAGRDEGRDRRW